MEPKKGVFTSELWVSVGAGVLGVVSALVALIVGLQYVSEEVGSLIIAIATSAIGLAVIVIPAWIAVRYTQARSEVKKNNGPI